MRTPEKLSWKVDLSVLLAAAGWMLISTTLGYASFIFVCRFLFRLWFTTPIDWSPDTVGKLTSAFIRWPRADVIIGLTIGRSGFELMKQLLFHPLANFPGPKIAALTGLYEFYYDVICGGRYGFAIKSLHKRYGPVVRISPSELHIDDLEFYDQLYTGAINPREKWRWPVTVFLCDSSIIATQSHELHRKRRAPLNPFFSKKSVIALLPQINAKVEQLCERISEWKGVQNPLSMKHAFGALTVDIVSEYAFGKSWNHLEAPDLNGWRFDGWESAAGALWVIKFFPLLGMVAKSLPILVVQKLDPAAAALMTVQKELKAKVQEMMASWSKNAKEGSDSLGTGRATIFHELLESAELPETDRNPDHLAQEAQTIMGGALSTNTRFLYVTLFYILSNPSVLARLSHELEAAMPDPKILPPLVELEQLEYLNAVIAEGHRINHGIPHRLARVSPRAPIRFQNWEIPPGWPVSMTIMLMHENEEVFPSPEVFDPARFLGIEGRAQRKYLVPFGKGTRGCLGQNVANAVIYCALVAVLRRFEFEIFETRREDVDITRDYFAGFPPKGSKGLQVLVK